MANGGPIEALLGKIDGALDQAVESKRNFDAADRQFNESTARALQAYAELAESRPEEVFGLVPTERDRFLVSEMLLPALDTLARTVRDVAASVDAEGVEGTEVDLGDAGDITGSRAAAGLAALQALSGIFESFFQNAGDVLKSPNGPDLLKQYLDFIKAEKQFFKETVGDLVGGAKEVIGGTVERVAGAGQSALDALGNMLGFGDGGDDGN